MAFFRLKTRKVGGGYEVFIPDEATAMFETDIHNDGLLLTPTNGGGMLVGYKRDLSLETELEQFERILERFKDAFRELAK